MRGLAVRTKRFAKRYNARVTLESVKPSNANAGLLFQERLCCEMEHLCKILKHQVRYSRSGS